MPDTSSPAARSDPKLAAHSYAPPAPLEDLHILDFLELAGSQVRAGEALAMHQSTVCRSLQLMRRQFRLVPGEGAGICRHGHNACLQHLRLAYRAHRLMAGLLRIGTDGYHQALLVGMANLQRVPPRFRSAGHWAELVRHGMVDGAMVSSFGLEWPLRPGQLPSWPGVAVLSLGSMALQLVAATPHPRRVLLPPRAVMPLLHERLVAADYGVEKQPDACQEPDAWLQRVRDRHLATPLAAGLSDAGLGEDHGLVPLARQPDLNEQLWLLLPEDATQLQPVQQSLRWLRRRVSEAAGVGSGA